MKQNNIKWASIAAIIIIVTAAYWWFTSSQYVDALVSAVASSSAVANHDGITGSAVQSDKPAITPFGDAAGPIVDARTMTVAQVAANLDATEFVSLFDQMGGNATVSGNGMYTVFVPTNGAFDRAKGIIANMSAQEKARLVEFHIVKGRALDTDALMAGSIQMASGDTLNLNLGVNSISLVGSAIVITQYNCKNGVVYTINNVLLPPEK